MAKKYNHFIPRNDAERGRWSYNFGEKVPVYADVLNLPAELVTLVATLTGSVTDKTNKVTIKYQEYQEALSAKNGLDGNELSELVRIAGIIKRSTGYTDNIGRDLGIVGTSTNIDTNYVKPVLKAETFPGFVAITFNKAQQLGVCLYARIKGTVGWELLGRPRVSPFKDRRELGTDGIAETREYMGVCWNGEEEFGQQSDIVFTLFGG
ncbi:hypothetical protein SAMN05421788_101554 [Filimonas lacunae]|uniref:Uncharacterized protein n=1 Tax=Filimonas lacunae TaxID=477680 RepID=A0A173MNR5_9BACT|nr:hypothetical protein [Filimonas lacunae]BAV09109.1 hypothetical protein FLA_5157 [Filimonas lacunae]SIS67410.1 hypothetical protein SAMN05421788_101554 [Filimonas lacunae]